MLGSVDVVYIDWKQKIWEPTLHNFGTSINQNHAHLLREEWLITRLKCLIQLSTIQCAYRQSRVAHGNVDYNCHQQRHYHIEAKFTGT